MSALLSPSARRPIGLGMALRSLFVWVAMLVVATPLLWALVTSVKPAQEVLAFPVTIGPQDFSLHAYGSLLFDTAFPQLFLNSLYVGLGTTAVVMLVGTLGAYALTRFRFPGAEFGAGVILFTYFLPPSIIVVPIYLIINDLGLADTRTGLILAYTSFSLPFAMWMMRLFFRTLSVETEQAARIDGASRMAVFFEIVLPQAVPGLISTSLFTFIAAYNEYLFSFIFINTESRKTLPVGIDAIIRSSYEIDWTMVMAAVVAMTLPVLLMIVCFQRYLLSGFGVGDTKG